MGSGERELVPSVTHRTNAVGESYRQDAIWRAIGAEPRAEDDREVEIVVELRAEPDNPYDPNAIAVRSLAGETLAYLPRALAAMVSLTVRGGFELPGGELAPLGIVLHVERRRR